jgi:hypothetical protein
VTIFYEDEACVFASLADMALGIWRAQPHILQIDKLDQQSASLLQAYPRGFSGLHLVANGASLPEADTRERAKLWLDKYGRVMGGLCCVIEGSGFWASAVQGVLTSLLWFQGRPFETKLCPTIEQGAQWLPALHAKKTGTQLHAALLQEALVNLRERVRAADEPRSPRD